MKKNFSSRLLPVFCFVAALAFGCGGDDDVTTQSCEQDVSEFNAALDALMSDIENNSKCLAFKAAAQDLLDCPGITAGQRSEYQSTVNSITCD